MADMSNKARYADNEKTGEKGRLIAPVTSAYVDYSKEKDERRRLRYSDSFEVITDAKLKGKKVALICGFLLSHDSSKKLGLYSIFKKIDEAYSILTVAGAKTEFIISAASFGQAEKEWQNWGIKTLVFSKIAMDIVDAADCPYCKAGVELIDFRHEAKTNADYQFRVVDIFTSDQTVLLLKDGNRIYAGIGKLFDYPTLISRKCIGNYHVFYLSIIEEKMNETDILSYINDMGSGENLKINMVSKAVQKI